jgi:hypothetical protein
MTEKTKPVWPFGTRYQWMQHSKAMEHEAQVQKDIKEAEKKILLEEVALNKRIRDISDEHAELNPVSDVAAAELYRQLRKQLKRALKDKP